MVRKRCPACGEVKPAAEFSPDRWQRDGLASACKPCLTVRSARYYAANRERVVDRQMRYQRRRRAARGPRRYPKVCNECLGAFKTVYSTARYCSPECRDLARLRRIRDRKYLGRHSPDSL